MKDLIAFGIAVVVAVGAVNEAYKAFKRLG